MSHVRRVFPLALTVMVLLTAVLESRAETLHGSRPNIVLVMPDDISYGSIHAYGGTKPSPHVDALYRKGLRFEDFHVSPTCSPSRAALMTGRHECYAGVTHTILMRDRMSLKATTLADMLKEAGYAAGIFGKWHLGDEAAYRPDKRGFEEVYIHGAGGIGQKMPHSSDFPNNDYNNPVLYHNGKAIETKGFCTDLFFDQSIRWMKQQNEQGRQPFFCYLPLNVNHGPHIPPILPDGTTGDSLINLDDNVGKLVAFLEESGLSENTLLIYMTDNGAKSGNKNLRGGKTSPYEGGTRVPCIMHWKGKIEGGVDCNRLAGHIDFYPTFAELAGSDAAVPGHKPWDGRSILPLMENPKADWESRLWIAHRTRWRDAATAQYSQCSIRNARYKIVMPEAGVIELYDLDNDVREQTDIAADHPEIVSELKRSYDAWWNDIQPYLVNDHLTDVPETCRPYHEIYLRDFGQKRFDKAMQAMAASSSKPKKRSRAKRRASDTNAKESLPRERTDSKPALPANGSTQRPNIIVIYTDDQGYGDASALNPAAKFQTPNLDRLANEGIAFTNGHSADSVCTPSRYGLLTGRYAWRTNQKRGVMGSEGECLIAEDRTTLASLLKEQGYHTAMVGKWHLGMDFPGEKGNRDWSQPTTGMPLDRGFDYFYGVPASLNFGVLAWFEGRHAAVPPTLLTSKKKNDRHVDYRIMPPYNAPQAAATGKGNAKRNARAGGLEVAPDFIDNQCLTRFTDKAIQWIGGKAKAAKEGEPFFLYLPYTSPHYPVCPLPEFHGQGQAGAYGEFVIETDYHVGRILKVLQEHDLDDNTLIVFTSDNGPEKSWPGRIEQYDHDSRGAYREGKRSVYEGGHRVPFLIRWPNGIAAPGRRSNELVGQVDLLATVAEIVGAKLPDNAGEDSQSFAEVLLSEQHDFERHPLINHGNGAGSYRYSITAGDWKLIPTDGKHSAELYNLADDPAETNNLATKHVETVERLTRQMNQIIARGRTTDGPKQDNDTGYWEDLTWMTKQQYEQLVNKAQ